MAESLLVDPSLPRSEAYRQLLPQLRALVETESDPIANAANLMAALRQALGFFWVGLYYVRHGELVLGPFQGPVACTRIPFTRGVCGAAYSSRETLVVPDVEQFPGHIACSSDSRSEIVVPVWQGDKIVAVLDVDSDRLHDFTPEVDQPALEQVAALIGQYAIPAD